MRMDGRIEWADLLMRMEYPGTLESDEQKFRNRLQQRVARMREKFTMVCWKDTTGTNNAIRARVLRKLTPAQLAARDGLGSTRGSTPGSTDSQGRVVPVPGKKFRESANASNAFAQVEQPQSQFARADLSNATSQQNHPVANTNFLAVNSQQFQPSESHRGLPPYSSASSSVGLSHQLTLPIVGGRRRPDYTNTMTQQDQPAAAYASNGYTQQVQNTAPLAGLPSNHDSQHQNIDAIPSADVYVETVTSNVGGSAGHQDTPQVPYPPSSAGSDADDEDDGCDEDDDSDKSDVDCEMDDDKDNGDKVENDENDGHDRLNKDIGRLWAEASIQMATLPAEVRRETTRYYKKVGLQTLLCLHGKISVDELEMRMLKSYGEFTSGLKRGRHYDTSDDDDEVDEMQSRRAKRTKRGGKSAGSSRQSLSGTQSCASSDFDGLPPGPRGEHQRHGALINTSRRPPTRPVGSAVQRLHQNRMRRPSPKAALY